MATTLVMPFTGVDQDSSDILLSLPPGNKSVSGIRKILSEVCLTYLSQLKQPVTRKTHTIVNLIMRSESLLTTVNSYYWRIRPNNREILTVVCTLHSAAIRDDDVAYWSKNHIPQSIFCFHTSEGFSKFFRIDTCRLQCLDNLVIVLFRYFFDLFLARLFQRTAD